MTDRLAAQVALVTGGAGGIGEATARLFFEEGALVAIVDMDAAALEQAAHAIDPSGKRVLAIAADLGEEPEAARAVAETVAHFGRLDVLANIAGVRLYGPITEASAESWDFILRINLLSVAYCAKFAIPEMAKNGGGVIVNVSSVNAVRARPGMAQYDATKGAIIALTRAMACDHARQNIRINAVCPGATLTMFHVRRRAAERGISLDQAEAELRSDPYPHILMRRQGQPREIAQALLFLACNESSYITGTSLMVDGGMGM